MKRLASILKSDLSDKVGLDFFQAVSLSVWLYHQESNKTLGEKQDRNYTGMLSAVLNKS